MSKELPAEIQMIKALGYRVFVRGNSPTYCHYTDGTRIAYAQWGGFRQSVSTVHKPNRQTGTGFVFAEEITDETLKGALHCFAPHWAYQRDRESVVKYADFDAFLNSSRWNAEMREV